MSRRRYQSGQTQWSWSHNANQQRMRGDIQRSSGLDFHRTAVLSKPPLFFSLFLQGSTQHWPYFGTRIACPKDRQNVEVLYHPAENEVTGSAGLHWVSQGVRDRDYQQVTQGKTQVVITAAGPGGQSSQNFSATPDWQVMGHGRQFCSKVILISSHI